ncbi:hypothetical protein N9937_01160 [bacterium]|nr:hypothetical protein [bacterium]
MASVEGFDRPAWGNPIDADLDWMRDTQNFLLGLAFSGSSVAPGWITQIDTSLNGNNAQPDEIIGTKGTRTIRIKLTWL